MATYATEHMRLLKPGGHMIHRVDYRDHFFKYPYMFLTFSQDTWRRYLNPGDLPRWRVSDHVRAFEAAGGQVRVLLTQQNDDAYGRVADRIHAEFKTRDLDDLKTCSADLLVRRPE